ncbi:putative glycosyltransferase [Tieghemostelium lacteum]|uniref:Putative glycosyltransferase n=1 Tax=Tieghemostelium lacteum TaxID=361077 RepID=A0A151ZC44_TIELA|nr:putative glycosyltransferase [Tieghemostelium lacteum]|eukprot:KYQ91523.1 putative glycosyltransferase [Tieghemostelium lacteum]
MKLKYDYNYSLSDDESNNNILDDESYRLDIEENNKLLFNRKSSNYNNYSSGPNSSNRSVNDKSKWYKFMRKNRFYLVVSLFLFALFSFILLLVILKFGNSDKVFSSYCKSTQHRNNQNLLKLGKCWLNYLDVKNGDYSCTPVSEKRVDTYQYYTTQLMSTPLVDIIVPLYNTPVYQLEECMESLLEQSFQQFRIILVNDGSNNSLTNEYIQSLKETDDRFLVVELETNQGLPNARNQGLLKSTAPFILFIDSDDLLEPTSVEKMYWKLLTSEKVYFTKGHTIGFQAFNYTWKKGFEENQVFLKENQITITTMFKRVVFYNNSSNYKLNETVLMFDSSFRDGMEDWDFYLNCASNGYWGETIPEPMDWYRRKDQLTFEKDWKNHAKKEHIQTILKSKYPDLYNQPDNYFRIPSTTESFYIHQNEYKYESINVLSKDKPRILFILPWLSTGGADKFNLNLCRQLIELGWEITIVTTEAQNEISYHWLSQFQLITSDIFIVNNFITINHVPNFMCYLLSSRSIDVVFLSNSELGYQMLPWISETCSSKPLIVDYNHMEEEYWKNGGYPRYSIAYSQYINHHFVSSKYLSNYYKSKSHVNNDKLLVQYININSEEFKFNNTIREEIKTRYAIPMDQVVILYAARMVEQKQPMLLLDLVNQLYQQSNNGENFRFSVFLVGDGPLKSKVDEYVHRNGLSDLVKVLGDVPPEDMKNVLSASDIVFLPSKMEGISMLFYEAMSIGVIPVGLNISGQSELVTNNTGYLLNNESDYLKILKYLIENPKHRKELSIQCRKRIESLFSVDIMGKSIVDSMCLCNKNRKENLIRPSKFSSHNQPILKEMVMQSLEYHKVERENSKLWQTVNRQSIIIENDIEQHNNSPAKTEEILELTNKIQQLERALEIQTNEYQTYLKETEKLYNKFTNQ